MTDPFNPNNWGDLAPPPLVNFRKTTPTHEWEISWRVILRRLGQKEAVARGKTMYLVRWLGIDYLTDNLVGINANHAFIVEAYQPEGMKI